MVVPCFIIFNLAQALLGITFLVDFKQTEKCHINSSPNGYNHGAINFEFSGHSEKTKDYALVQV